MEVYGAYRANVALVRDALAENKLQMGQVDQSLVTFQSGLLGVEREMLPIYKLTEKLRETQRNIDVCVHELRRINENFVAAQTLAPTLMNGVKYDQDEYVGALQKLLVAISFLEKHRSYEGSGKALDQARELLSQARRKCKADFLSAVAVLSRGSRREETNKLAWGKPNKEDVAKAAQLLACLLSSHVDLAELMGDYGKQRFQVVKMFLSDGGSSSSSGVQFSVAEPLDALAQRLSDIETTLEAEKTLAEAVFSSEELCHAAFRHAAHPMLESWKTDLDASLQSIASINKQQQLQTPSAIADPFKLLLLHELLSARLKGMDALVQPPLLLRDRKGKTPLDDPWVLTKLLGVILADIALGTKQRLFGFQVELTEQIGVGDRSLTKDGNVHPVSSHMLNFVRHVCDHTKPLRVLLTRESNVTPASFIETAIMQLIEALQGKTTQAKSRNDLKQLFLANNYGYISNSLPPCSDKEIAAHIAQEIKPRIDELCDTAIKSFITTSYQSFETFLCDPKEKLVYAKGGSLLTLESGRLLKEKFAKFNEQMDDIYATQRLFIVAEPPLRHRLIQAAVDAIVPRYTAFYDKYSVVQFSKKNSAKYLKYTPKAVAELLKELFLGEVVPTAK